MINSDVKRICNFYLGEGHFLCTVIPYLVMKANENNRIIVIVDNEEKEFLNIKMFVEKYFCDGAKKLYKNMKLMKIQDLNSNDIAVSNIICIKDSFKYNILDSLILYINVELIRCYPIDCGEQDIKNVISDNEYILNTRGIFEINEVFKLDGSEKQKFEHSFSFNVN